MALGAVGEGLEKLVAPGPWYLNVALYTSRLKGLEEKVTEIG